MNLWLNSSPMVALIRLLVIVEPLEPVSVLIGVAKATQKVERRHLARDHVIPETSTGIDAHVEVLGMIVRSGKQAKRKHFLGQIAIIADKASQGVRAGGANAVGDRSSSR